MLAQIASITVVCGRIGTTDEARRNGLRLLLVIALAGLVGTCSSPPPLLEQVLETGMLRVVTRDSPTAYVVGPDGPSGPETTSRGRSPTSSALLWLLKPCKASPKSCRSCYPEKRISPPQGCP